MSISTNKSLSATTGYVSVLNWTNTVHPTDQCVPYLMTMIKTMFFFNGDHLENYLNPFPAVAYSGGLVRHSDVNRSGSITEKGHDRRYVVTTRTYFMQSIYDNRQHVARLTKVIIYYQVYYQYIYNTILYKQDDNIVLQNFFIIR